VGKKQKHQDSENAGEIAKSAENNREIREILTGAEQRGAPGKIETAYATSP
jgi:hypothetical protein